MSAIFDMMGTVTSVTEDSGSVENPAIQGPVATSFRASQFFAFGVRCTGSLTDFLDPGMQVKVRYIFGQPHSDIVAVWLGDKPDCLTADPFYNRAGYVVSISEDHLLAKTNFCDKSIFVSKDVLYSDGYRLKDTETEVNVGQALMFDGVPIRTDSSEIQYLATCGWFGLNEPRILDRFQYFLSARLDEEYVEVDNVVGRVSVIPNDSVALVDVEAFNSGKVILTKENFLPPCESLRFSVCVGEELMMRLRFGCHYSVNEMWFAVAASKRCGPDAGLVIVEKSRQQHHPAWYLPPEDEEIASDANMESDDTAEAGLLGEPQEEEEKVVLAAPQDMPVPLNPKTEVKLVTSDEMDLLSQEPEPSNTSEGELIVPTSGLDEVQPTPSSPKEEIVIGFGYETNEERLINGEESEPARNGQEESDVEVLYEAPVKMPRLEEVWVPCPLTLEDETEEAVFREASSDEESESPKAVDETDKSVLAKALAFLREEEVAESADVEGSDRDALIHFPEKRAPFGRVRRAAPFKKGPGTKTYLLDWSAVVAMEQGAIKFSALVGSDFGEVLVEIDDVVISAMNDNKPVTSKTLRANGQNVYFDAERRKEGDKFEVKRVWFKQSSRPCPELLLKPQLRYTGLCSFDPAQVYRGEIVSVPLHDCAIAIVNDIPVLVTLDSLVTDRDYNLSCTTIDMFLNVGSTVLVLVEENRGMKASYFRAKKCWDEELCLPTDPQDPVSRSWSDVWRTVELFAEGTITAAKDGCVGITISSSQSVDATNCRFFFNGNLSRLIDHIGATVICHVISVQGKYVVPFASNRRFLDYSFFEARNLAVPKNLIDEKVYEGVVEDFPLVDFAVCRIGVIPVISYLSPVKCKTKSQCNAVSSHVKKSKKKGHFNTVVEKDVRIGQRVMLNVKEESYKNSTFLVCTTMILNEYNDDKKVMVNFSGQVVKQPRPTGLIEANGGRLKVSFDMSCVRNPIGTMDVSSWTKRVRKALREKNASVHFTAKKGTSPEKPHAAYMVWIDNF